MIKYLQSKNNYRVLPVRLVRYIVPVSILGPILAGLLVIAFRPSLDSGDLFSALILGLLALIAERYPLNLTHRTNVNVATAVYVAMFLILPIGIVPFVALIAAGVAQMMRMRATAEMGFAESLFNIGQTALYVSLTTVAVDLADRTPLDGFWFGQIDLGTCIVASVALHLANTALVSGAAALHLGTHFSRVWRTNLPIDIGPHVAMTLMGVCASVLGEETPLLIPTLFVPALLIHRAIGQNVMLRENISQALASMVEIIELRDPYTAGHSRRVAKTARLIAIRMGLTDEEADLIESAGQVHDIGKVAIDTTIVLKAGKLSDDEWEQMKLHPGYGAEVLARFESYKHGVPMVRSHHEWWDGTGYPDQLSGEYIPLGARILAVADAFDAMTSDRPYRSGMSVDRAVSILQVGAGKQWDHAIVDIFVELAIDPESEVQVFRRETMIDSVPNPTLTETPAIPVNAAA